MASHPLLKALRASAPAFGVWLTLPGAHHARLVATASPRLSWVLIDCEHGLTPLHPGAADAIQAIAAAGPTAPSALVRVPATAGAPGAGWQIKYALDAGARGIVAPMVSTAAQAASIVAESRFPPRGRRGFGSPFTHGVWGVTATEYLQGADAAVLVIVQIETRDAVQNLDAIAAVDGVDVLFIGPYDLSISLGYDPPSPDPHPDVENVIQRIRDVAHNAGKKVAIYCTSGTQSAKRAQEGFDMINVVSDSGALTAALASELATAAGDDIDPAKKGMSYA